MNFLEIEMLTKLEFAQQTDDDINVYNLIQELQSGKIEFATIDQLVDEQKLSRNDFAAILKAYIIQTQPRNESPSSPTEFDAYSKQITEDLRDTTKNNPSVKQQLITWLRTPSKEMPITLVTYTHILDDWKRSDLINKTDHMRRFKIRLYNELFSERIR